MSADIICVTSGPCRLDFRQRPDRPRVKANCYGDQQASALLNGRGFAFPFRAQPMVRRARPVGLLQPRFGNNAPGYGGLWSRNPLRSERPP